MVLGVGKDLTLTIGRIYAVLNELVDDVESVRDGVESLRELLSRLADQCGDVDGQL